MKHFQWGWGIGLYLGLVFMSFLYLTGMVLDYELHHPPLVNKKWKRVLWLLSCLLFIPLVVFMAGLPGYIVSELKRFFSIRRPENGEKHDTKGDCK